MSAFLSGLLSWRPVARRFWIAVFRVADSAVTDAGGACRSHAVKMARVRVPRL
jgi:hypothetical protein